MTLDPAFAWLTVATPCAQLSVANVWTNNAAVRDAPPWLNTTWLAANRLLYVCANGTSLIGSQDLVRTATLTVCASTGTSLSSCATALVSYETEVSAEGSATLWSARVDDVFATPTIVASLSDTSTVNLSVSTSSGVAFSTISNTVRTCTSSRPSVELTSNVINVTCTDSAAGPAAVWAAVPFASQNDASYLQSYTAGFTRNPNNCGVVVSVARDIEGRTFRTDLQYAVDCNAGAETSFIKYEYPLPAQDASTRAAGGLPSVARRSIFNATYTSATTGLATTTSRSLGAWTTDVTWRVLAPTATRRQSTLPTSIVHRWAPTSTVLASWNLTWSDGTMTPQLTSIVEVTPTGSTTLCNVTYDSWGRLSSRQCANATNTAVTQVAYTSDGLLSSISESDTGYSRITDYSTAGFPTTRRNPALTDPILMDLFSGGRLNRRVGASTTTLSFAYDTDGRVKAVTVQSSATNGLLQSTSYSYDAVGRVSRRTAINLVAGTTTADISFVYDEADRVSRVYDVSSGAVLARFEYGARGDLIVLWTAVYGDCFVLEDHQGPRALVSVTTGTVLQWLRFSPFGRDADSATATDSASVAVLIARMAFRPGFITERYSAADTDPYLLQLTTGRVLEPAVGRWTTLRRPTQPNITPNVVDQVSRFTGTRATGTELNIDSLVLNDGDPLSTLTASIMLGSANEATVTGTASIAVAGSWNIADAALLRTEDRSKDTSVLTPQQRGLLADITDFLAAAGALDRPGTSDLAVAAAALDVIADGAPKESQVVRAEAADTLTRPFWDTRRGAMQSLSVLAAPPVAKRVLAAALPSGSPCILNVSWFAVDATVGDVVVAFANITTTTGSGNATSVAAVDVSGALTALWCDDMESIIASTFWRDATYLQSTTDFVVPTTITTTTNDTLVNSSGRFLYPRSNDQQSSITYAIRNLTQHVLVGATKDNVLNGTQPFASIPTRIAAEANRVMTMAANNGAATDVTAFCGPNVVHTLTLSPSTFNITQYIETNATVASFARLSSTTTQRFVMTASTSTDGGTSAVTFAPLSSFADDFNSLTRLSLNGTTRLIQFANAAVMMEMLEATALMRSWPIAWGELFDEHSIPEAVAPSTATVVIRNMILAPLVYTVGASTCSATLRVVVSIPRSFGLLKRASWVNVLPAPSRTIPNTVTTSMQQRATSSSLMWATGTSAVVAVPLTGLLVDEPSAGNAFEVVVAPPVGDFETPLISTLVTSVRIPTHAPIVAYPQLYFGRPVVVGGSQIPDVITLSCVHCRDVGLDGAEVFVIRPTPNVNISPRPDILGVYSSVWGELPSRLFAFRNGTFALARPDEAATPYATFDSEGSVLVMTSDAGCTYAVANDQVVARCTDTTVATVSVSLQRSTSRYPYSVNLASTVVTFAVDTSTSQLLSVSDSTTNSAIQFVYAPAAMRGIVTDPSALLCAVTMSSSSVMWGDSNCTNARSTALDSWGRPVSANSSRFALLRPNSTAASVVVTSAGLLPDGTVLTISRSATRGQRQICRQQTTLKGWIKQSWCRSWLTVSSTQCNTTTVAIPVCGGLVEFLQWPLLRTNTTNVYDVRQRLIESSSVSQMGQQLPNTKLWSVLRDGTNRPIAVRRLDGSGFTVSYPSDGVVVLRRCWAINFTAGPACSGPWVTRNDPPPTLVVSMTSRQTGLCAQVGVDSANTGTLLPVTACFSAVVRSSGVAYSPLPVKNISIAAAIVVNGTTQLGVTPVLLLSRAMLSRVVLRGVSAFWLPGLNGTILRDASTAVPVGFDAGMVQVTSRDASTLAPTQFRVGLANYRAALVNQSWMGVFGVQTNMTLAASPSASPLWSSSRLQQPAMELDDVFVAYAATTNRLVMTATQQSVVVGRSAAAALTAQAPSVFPTALFLGTPYVIGGASASWALFITAPPLSQSLAVQARIIQGSGCTVVSTTIVGPTDVRVTGNCTSIGLLPLTLQAQVVLSWADVGVTSSLTVPIRGTGLVLFGAPVALNLNPSGTYNITFTASTSLLSFLQSSDASSVTIQGVTLMKGGTSNPSSVTTVALPSVVDASTLLVFPNVALSNGDQVAVALSVLYQGLAVTQAVSALTWTTVTLQTNATSTSSANVSSSLAFPVPQLGDASSAAWWSVPRNASQWTVLAAVVFNSTTSSVATLVANQGNTAVVLITPAWSVVVSSSYTCTSFNTASLAWSSTANLFAVTLDAVCPALFFTGAVIVGVDGKGNPVSSIQTQIVDVNTTTLVESNGVAASLSLMASGTTTYVRRMNLSDPNNGIVAMSQSLYPAVLLVDTNGNFVVFGVNTQSTGLVQFVFTNLSTSTSQSASGMPSVNGTVIGLSTAPLNATRVAVQVRFRKSGDGADTVRLRMVTVSLVDFSAQDTGVGEWAGASEYTTSSTAFSTMALCSTPRRTDGSTVAPADVFVLSSTARGVVAVSPRFTGLLDNVSASLIITPTTSWSGASSSRPSVSSSAVSNTFTSTPNPSFICVSGIQANAMLVAVLNSSSIAARGLQGGFPSVATATWTATNRLVVAEPYAAGLMCFANGDASRSSTLQWNITSIVPTNGIFKATPYNDTCAQVTTTTTGCQCANITFAFSSGELLQWMTCSYSQCGSNALLAASPQASPAAAALRWWPVTLVASPMAVTFAGLSTIVPWSAAAFLVDGVRVSPTFVERSVRLTTYVAPMPSTSSAYGRSVSWSLLLLDASNNTVLTFGPFSTVMERPPPPWVTVLTDNSGSVTVLHVDQGSRAATKLCLQSNASFASVCLGAPFTLPTDMQFVASVVAAFAAYVSTDGVQSDSSDTVVINVDLSVPSPPASVVITATAPGLFDTSNRPNVSSVQGAVTSINLGTIRRTGESSYVSFGVYNVYVPISFDTMMVSIAAYVPAGIPVGATAGSLGRTGRASAGTVPTVASVLVGDAWNATTDASVTNTSVTSSLLYVPPDTNTTTNGQWWIYAASASWTTASPLFSTAVTNPNTPLSSSSNSYVAPLAPQRRIGTFAMRDFPNSTGTAPGASWTCATAAHFTSSSIVASGQDPERLLSSTNTSTDDTACLTVGVVTPTVTCVASQRTVSSGSVVSLSAALPSNDVTTTSINGFEWRLALCDPSPCPTLTTPIASAPTALIGFGTSSTGLRQLTLVIVGARVIDGTPLTTAGCSLNVTVAFSQPLTTTPAPTTTTTPAPRTTTTAAITSTTIAPTPAPSGASTTTAPPPSTTATATTLTASPVTVPVTPSATGDTATPGSSTAVTSPLTTGLATPPSTNQGTTPATTGMTASIPLTDATATTTTTIAPSTVLSPTAAPPPTTTTATGNTTSIASSTGMAPTTTSPVSTTAAPSNLSALVFSLVLRGDLFVNALKNANSSATIANALTSDVATNLRVNASDVRILSMVAGSLVSVISAPATNTSINALLTSSWPSVASAYASTTGGNASDVIALAVSLTTSAPATAAPSPTTAPTSTAPTASTPSPVVNTTVAPFGNATAAPSSTDAWYQNTTYIVLIAVGGAVVLLIIVVVCVKCCRKGDKKEDPAAARAAQLRALGRPSDSAVQGGHRPSELGGDASPPGARHPVLEFPNGMPPRRNPETPAAPPGGKGLQQHSLFNQAPQSPATGMKSVVTPAPVPVTPLTPAVAQVNPQPTNTRLPNQPSVSPQRAASTPQPTLQSAPQQGNAAATRQGGVDSAQPRGATMPNLFASPVAGPNAAAPQPSIFGAAFDQPPNSATPQQQQASSGAHFSPPTSPGVPRPAVVSARSDSAVFSAPGSPALTPTAFAQQPAARVEPAVAVAQHLSGQGPQRGALDDSPVASSSDDDSRGPSVTPLRQPLSNAARPTYMDAQANVGSPYNVTAPPPVTATVLGGATSPFGITPTPNVLQGTVVASTPQTADLFDVTAVVAESLEGSVTRGAPVAYVVVGQILLVLRWREGAANVGALPDLVLSLANSRVLNAIAFAPNVTVLRRDAERVNVSVTLTPPRAGDAEGRILLGRYRLEDASLITPLIDVRPLLRPPPPNAAPGTVVTTATVAWNPVCDGKRISATLQMPLPPAPPSGEPRELMLWPPLGGEPLGVASFADDTVTWTLTTNGQDLYPIGPSEPRPLAAKFCTTVAVGGSAEQTMAVYVDATLRGVGFVSQSAFQITDITNPAGREVPSAIMARIVGLRVEAGDM